VRPWIPLPHDPIEKLEENLWTVEGMLPRGPLRRRMMIARYRDGRLAFLNAVPLREEAMRDIEHWGTPEFLVVANGFHRLDLQPYKTRYPKLQVICGPASAPRVSQVVPVDGGFDRLPREPDLRIERLDGTKVDEPYARASGTLCIPGDAIFNVPRLPGIGGLVLRLVGSAGSPRVTAIARLFVVGDRARLRDQFSRLAAEPGLSRIAVCHGQTIRERAPEVLREVAIRL
jgi:hypothetical protein